MVCFQNLSQIGGKLSSRTKKIRGVIYETFDTKGLSDHKNDFQNILKASPQKVIALAEDSELSFLGLFVELG